MLVSPSKESFPLAKKLEFPFTNNEAQYKTCIFGLPSLLVLGVNKEKFIGDSLLVISLTSELGLRFIN